MTLTMLGASCLVLAPVQNLNATEPNSSPISVETRPGYQLKPFVAQYDVLRNDKKIGELNASLIQHENGLWNYRLESVATDWLVRLLGISTQESAWFAWRNGRVIPLTYRLDSREPGHDRFWQHRYRWLDQTSATVTHQGEYEIPLSPETLDPLTLRIEVAARLDQVNMIEDSWTFQVLERNRIETQNIRRISMQPVRLGMLCFDTIELYRFRREGSSRNYSSWHAQSIHALPVKIRHIDDDNVIEMQLVDWSFDDSNNDTPEQHRCDSA